MWEVVVWGVAVCGVPAGSLVWEVVVWEVAVCAVCGVPAGSVVWEVAVCGVPAGSLVWEVAVCAVCGVPAGLLVWEVAVCGVPAGSLVWEVAVCGVPAGSVAAFFSSHADSAAAVSVPLPRLSPSPASKKATDFIIMTHVCPPLLQARKRRTLS